ncbi:hypothetical protein THAOC_12871 [Thalassiosira oceanica]|uniref:Uncharacterized protein n=1 Tax=Thalassiosira oceanica TaxID=159749 RepID=K0SZ03_THAOC|nr:hypothetical protein THAOC_12871 [Thalassiosira oceanica]|eukprot:EJK66221.1 hypothetical protein THAOC_12871 [Thalassiosira oceanica]
MVPWVPSPGHQGRPHRNIEKLGSHYHRCAGRAGKATQIAPQPRASIELRLTTLKVDRLKDEFIPAAASSSDQQIRTRTGGHNAEAGQQIP